MREEREARIRREQDFYNRCAEILNVAHEYHEPVRRRNRWNTRFLGNGRFPGYGVIRMYNASCIHIIFSKPTVSKIFECDTDVFAFLEEYKNDRSYNIQEGN